jgi:hypothetical protein
MARQNAMQRNPEIRTLSALLQSSETIPRLRAELLGVGDADALEAPMCVLCAELLEESPFFAPYALLPALKAYGDESVRLACIWSGDQLVGLWPVQKRRFYARLPLSFWSSWTHDHCYFAAPLIRRGWEVSVLGEFYALLCEGDEARSFVRFGRIEKDGAVFTAIEASAASGKRLCYEAGAIARAMLQAGASAEATLAVHVKKKKRKELARLRNRLDELGVVQFREFASPDDISEWTEAFLALEDRGWKGTERTSLQSSETGARWFRETLAGAHAAGSVHFLRLDLDERPIAMLVSLISNGAAYSLKICHDPEFDRYSPGVMIEIEAMRSLLERADFRFADSCATPDHSMINGLWRARRVVTGLNVSGRGLFARAGLGLAKLLEGARAHFPKG